MYDKKTFYYFALAIIGFLLWHAWETDHPQRFVTANASSPSQLSAASSQSVPAVQTEIAQRPISSSQLIHINTDTLEVVIDKLGGNIVSLKLPKYPTSYEKPHEPVTMLTNSIADYSLAQTNFVGKTGLDTSKLIFNSTASTYQLEPGKDKLSVVLKAKADGQEINKIYTFKQGKYEINVSYALKNQSSTPWVGSYNAEIKRRGLGDTGGTFGLHTYTGAAISSAAKPYEKISYKDMDKDNLNRSIKAGWLAMQERYFVSAWIPNNTETMHYFSHVTSVGPTDKPQDRVYTLGFQSPEITVQPSKTLLTNSNLYVGPEIADNLQQAAPHLDLVIDYGWFSIFSVPIFKVMQWIYYVVQNWGVAIILVTVLIKLLFYKLSETSYRSMARMKTLQPRLLALKDRYGEDRQKLSQATMELYRNEKVNPLGGCLPMIIQIPVFIALYYVLIESVELRQAPFVFWIHDLSVKDPYYVLPILMGLSWMLQQKLNPPPPDPVQAKMMMLFPVVFTVLFATFPAGLVLYWIVNNCLSILQQWHIMRKVEGEKTSKKSITKGRVSSSR